MSKILNENEIEKSYGNIIHQNITINPNECTYREQEVLRILDADGNYVWAKHYSGYEPNGPYDYYFNGYYLTYSQVQNATVVVEKPKYEYNETFHDEGSGWYEWETTTTYYWVTCELYIDGTGKVAEESFDSSGETSFGIFLVTGNAEIKQSEYSDSFTTTDSGFDPPWL